MEHGKRAGLRHFFKSRLSGLRRLVPRFVENNHAALLTGESAYRSIISALKSAQKSINIEMYIFSDDKTVSRILKQKTKSGVKVNILYDAYGSKETSQKFFKDLRKAGIAVAEHNSINPIKSLRSAVFHFNERDHRKIIVVDGKMAFIGGMNIGKEFYSNWRDIMVKIEGPVVQDIQLAFFKQWQRFELRPLGNRRVRIHEDIHLLDEFHRAVYFPELKPAGRQMMAVVTGSPYSTKMAIYSLYLDAIKSAKKHIIIETPYFIPTISLVELLAKKAMQGVDVEIVIPDYSTSDHPSLNLVSYRYLKRFIEAGAKIYRCSYESKIFHAKLCVVDSAATIVGSSNIDRRSWKHNYEINALVFDREFAKECLRHIRSDLGQSSLVKRAELSDLSFKDRLVSWLLWPIRGWL